jgi:hypothetical protein
LFDAVRDRDRLADGAGVDGETAQVDKSKEVQTSYVTSERVRLNVRKQRRGESMALLCRTDGRELAGAGSVPKAYSCRLSAPSASGSALHTALPHAEVVLKWVEVYRVRAAGADVTQRLARSRCV